MQQWRRRMSDLVIRFFVGGAVVSAFAVLGDLFRPKSFAGVFNAAPSVALATLALTAMKETSADVALEGRSMIVGALALAAYSQLTSWLLMRRGWRSLPAALASLALWFAVALGLWVVLPR
jgi:uncharacterized protein DUF3147